MLRFPPPSADSPSGHKVRSTNAYAPDVRLSLAVTAPQPGALAWSRAPPGCRGGMRARWYRRGGRCRQKWKRKAALGDGADRAVVDVRHEARRRVKVAIGALIVARQVGRPCRRRRGKGITAVQGAILC